MITSALNRIVILLWASAAFTIHVADSNPDTVTKLTTKLTKILRK